MVGKTKAPTKDEARRMDRIVELGCICCRRELGRIEPAEVHHIVEGYRLGHWYTLPLCAWHHRGLTPEAMRIEDARHLFGPSLAHHKRAFIERYGTERELHRQVNVILERRGDL